MISDFLVDSKKGIGLMVDEKRKKNLYYAKVSSTYL